MQLILPFENPVRPAFTRRCPVCGGTWANYRSESINPTFTYVMQRQWWVKIGKSYHPWTRLRELHAINRQRYILCPPAMDRTEPLRLVGVIGGDVEHELHERFAHLHAGGEWFDTDDEVRDWMARLPVKC